MHFSSMNGLPGVGKMARWKQLEAPHIPQDLQRADQTAGAKGERVVFESSQDGELIPHENPESGITYLNMGDAKYAVSPGVGGVHYVKNLNSAEKVANFMDQFEGNPAAQEWLVARARQMGIIPPDISTSGSPQNAPPTLQDSLWSAVGTGAKTISLGFLGGLGAGAGWGLGTRLTAKDEKKMAATQDPADSEDAPGEAPAAYRPESPIPYKPADPAATSTAKMTEGRFGHLPSDPL